MTIHLIAIVGGSGAGKTWLAQYLLEAFGADAGRVPLDDFYRDLSQVGPEERARTNFDHPAAIDWPLFRRAITAIRQGGAVDLPDYDFATHTRRAGTRVWTPRRLVLLDGLWLLRRAELRRLYSLSVFVDCPAGMRLERRVERDQRERGRSPDSVRAQFERDVAPMHRRFVASQVKHADVVVDSRSGREELAGLRARCRRLLQDERTGR